MRNKKVSLFLIGCSIIFSLTIASFFGLKWPSSIKNHSMDYSINASSPEGSILIRAIPRSPQSIDPVECWDRNGIDVIRQVAETLWFYNWTDPTLPRINMLAESQIWLNTTALSVILRQGVLFHDGTPFNASAVKWNIDRMLYLFNHTGALSSDEDIGDPHSLFEGSDGSPLLVGFEVTGTYSGIIHLAQPFSSLMDLFCFTGASMLSPIAHASDSHSFIDLSGNIVGTGSYMYERYIGEHEVSFSRWDNYWGGPIPNEINVVYFEKMVFKILDDDNLRNNAMLNGDVDYLSGIESSFIDSLKADPDIRFHESTIPDFSLSYLVFNNRQINVTWRKVMSYAFNYTYIIEDYWQDRVFRSYGPITSGFGEWYTSDVETLAPYYNITLARMILTGNDPTPNPVPGIPEAIGRDPLNDADWGVGPNMLIEFNYSYNTDDTWRSDLYDILKSFFDDISIGVIDGGTDWVYFILRAYGYVPGGYDDLQIFWIGWGPDYLDPINMILPLLSNDSSSNSAQVNDPTLEQMIEDYLKEIDHATKVEMIYNMSEYIVSELYPHLYIYHERTQTCHSIELFNVPYDMNRYTFYAYPIKHSYYLYVSSPDDIIFLSGESGNSISWNLVGTNLTSPMYYVYKDDNLITNDTWQSGDSVTISLDELSVGTYNYSILVQNNLSSVEDSIIVNVIPRLLLSHPPDISYTEGSTGNTINWVVSEGYEQNTAYYIYNDNNTEIQTDSWEINVSISLNVDGLSVGSHTFRIEVHNSLEYIEDSVEVKVNRKQIPGFPLLILIGFTSIGITCVGIKLKQKLK